MAYVNVAEWGPDQVAEWLKGLDDVLQPYIHSFVTKEITGRHLLHLATDDFPSLNITCIGHQEIILQGVELLSNIHYQIHQENVQHIALHLSSKARSIYNELRLCQTCDGQYRNDIVGEEEKDDKEVDLRIEGNKDAKKERVSTSILSGVADVLSSVKVLVSWLHRTPFHGIEQYDELKSSLLDLSIRLATIAQRDSFAENPVSVIMECCFKLAEMADAIIQDSKDPLILQPAFLDVVTIKKRADDNWGLGIYSSYHGVHQISMLRSLSPAHTCGKLMGGDQVVQVNYQTVVGWTSHKVTQLMQENPVQVILTVKKCPRHVNTITEIYFKPFRLPSKKRTYSPWPNNAISGQPYDLQSIPNLQFIKSFDGRSAAQRAISTEPHPKANDTPAPAASLNSSGSDVGAATGSESESDEGPSSDLDDDAFLTDGNYGGGNPSLSGRLFQPKPRPHVQRRATIPGAMARHTLPFDRLLQGYCHRQLLCSPIGDSFSQDSCCSLFRSKDSPDNRMVRPHTCIGTEKKQGAPKGSCCQQWKMKQEEKEEEQEEDDDSSMPFIDESDEKEDDDDEGRKEVVSSSSYRKLENSLTVVTPASFRSSPPAVPSPTTTPPIRITPPQKSSGKELSSSPVGPHSSPSTQQHFTTRNSPDTRHRSPPKSPVDVDDPKTLRRISDERPKLDKSYSSPTYDLEDREAVTFLDSATLDVAKTKLSTSMDARRELEVYETTASNRPEELSRSSDIIQTSSVVATEISSKTFFPRLHDNDASSSIGSSACSSIQITPPSVSSLAAENSLYILRFKGSRRISCRDLGLGDHHGWLYRRKDSKGFLLSHRWEKRWFILKKSYLYGYRDKDALKADSLIYLPGFQVCPASDVKSKRFAFKIYHSSGATFYFACDNAEERSRWMSQMGVSAIPSGQLLPQHEKESFTCLEAYYSETDDELEKSPSTQRSAHAAFPASVSPGKEGVVSPEAGLITTGSPVPSNSKVSKGTLPSPSTSSRGSTGTRMSSLGSLSSLAGGRSQGLKFLQSPRGALGHPVPTQNFRSYIRVREVPTTARNQPTVESSAAGGSPKGTGNLAEGRERKISEGKGVRRKGSLRERLRQLPASLTLDRRKGQKQPSPTGEGPPLRVVSGSKSETSLLDPPPSGVWGARKRLTPDSADVAFPRGRSPSDGDAITKGGRRGSIGGLSASSSSLGSVSPRRGSLDCLVSKGASPSVSLVRTTEGSTGSLAAQEEYREGSPEKLWIRSLRSPQPLARPLEGERLKRAAHYQPLHRGGGASPLQPAFELSLSASSKKNPAPSPLRGSKPNPAQRPQVPPRTKFLSPKERFVSAAPSLRTSVPTPPNLTLSPPLEEADSPRTPLKPAMGVSMIGKQRRTPGVLSPREILPEYPGMEYPPTFEPESYTLNLSPEASGGYTSPLQPQPKEIISTSPSNTTLSPISNPSPLQGSPSSPTLPKPSGTIQGYVNISHVSSTLAELSVKSFHHNIYVTSPCREAPSSRGSRQPPPLPPNKPSRGVPFVQLQTKGRAHPDSACPINDQKFFGTPLSTAAPQPPLEILSPQDSANNYLPMGVVCTPHRFPGGNPANRIRLVKPRGGDESRC